MTSYVGKILAVHASLDEAGIPHAFGGALALGYHVESPRATVDIDVNITTGPDDGAHVLRSLPPNVTWDDADVEQIRRDGQTRVFWDRTPLDLFFPQNVLHETVAGRTEEVPLGNGRIPVLSATDLTVFKALFDRPKDWMDIGEMLAYGQVDRDEVSGWLVRLLGDDDPRVSRFADLT